MKRRTCLKWKKKPKLFWKAYAPLEQARRKILCRHMKHLFRSPSFASLILPPECGGMTTLDREEMRKRDEAEAAVELKEDIAFVKARNKYKKARR